MDVTQLTKLPKSFFILLIFVGVIYVVVIYSVFFFGVCPDQANIVFSGLNLLIALLLFFAIYIQSILLGAQTDLSDKQTKLFQLEKKPMIGILATDDMFKFKIKNFHKYPVRILNCQANDVSAIQQIERKTIYPDDSVDLNLGDIVTLETPVILEIIIEVANLYDESIKAKYRYDGESRDLTLIE